MSQNDNPRLPPPTSEQALFLDARTRAFLQGEIVLADLYELSHEELFELASQGHHLYESGQVASAQKVFEGLTALDPTNAFFHTGLGTVYQHQGILERARIEYDRALALNERDIPARCNRAEVLLQMGALEEAMEDLKRILELDPQGESGHTRRARGITLALSAMAQRNDTPEATPP